jgi:hypothetical protein
MRFGFHLDTIGFPNGNDPSAILPGALWHPSARHSGVNLQHSDIYWIYQIISGFDSL